MMKKIELKLENNEVMVLIEVPAWATLFDVIPKWNYLRFSDSKTGCHDDCTKTDRHENILEQGETVYEVLGSYAPEWIIEFHIKPDWVKSWDGVASTPEEPYRCFENYINEIPKYRDARTSFISLLRAETKKQFPFLDNPTGEKPEMESDGSYQKIAGGTGAIYDGKDYAQRCYEYDLKLWSEADKFVMPEKFVVLLKK